jgi:hypothetical protein
MPKSVWTRYETYAHENAKVGVDALRDLRPRRRHPATGRRQGNRCDTPPLRRWNAVSQEAGNLDELRVILGNALAIKVFWEGPLPFPDGAFLAKLA